MHRTGKAIADDFSGYGYGLADSTNLVTVIFEQLEEAVAQFIPESDMVEPPKPLSSTRQSRSSSKVRFQEDLETDEEHESRSVTSVSSRSIPINERWGGFEVPEPEKDVGREVLYQVTQEAFNELLDPVFRLREDLALAVQATVVERKRHRSRIVSTVKDALNVKNHLDMYQRRWRRKLKRISCNYRATLETEATYYLDCLHNIEANPTERLTAEICPRCAEKDIEGRVPLGEYCPTTHCGYLSSGRLDEATSKNPCSRCAERGMELRVGDVSRWITCTECGLPSTPTREEEARLLRIIRGSQLSSSHQENQHHSITDVDTPGQTPSNGQGSGHEVITNGDTPAFKAATPAHHDPPSPFVQAIQDLSLSLADLDAADPPSLEQDIIQRPLDTLPEAAGYVAVDPSQDIAAGPDPTLPQHRSSSTPPLDPTLPQNRPNTESEENIELHRYHTPGSPLNDSDSDSDVDSDFSSQLAAAGKQKSLRQRDMHPFGNADVHSSAAVAKWYAALNLIEHEDKERGGPGRLNFREFEEVMKGDKGSSLGFLGSWIEMANL